VLVGAGVLVGLAGAVAAAGWWALGGFALAALLAFASVRAGWHTGRATAAGWWTRVPEGARFAAGTSLAALLASTFGAYVVPAQPAVAAGVVIAGAAVADAAGLRITPYARRWIVGLLLLAAVALVAVCLAVPPVPGPPGRGGPGGIALAAAVIFPFLAGPGASRRPWPLAGAAVAGLAVASVALYQAGPVRLGLSPTSIRDLLSAADAGALGTLLAVAVALATVPGVLAALTASRRCLGGEPSNRRERAVPAAPGAVLAVIAAAILPTFDILLIAAAASLLAVLVANLVRLRQARSVETITAVVLGAALPAALPAVSILVAVLLAALGTAVAEARYRGRRD